MPSPRAAATRTLATARSRAARAVNNILIETLLFYRYLLHPFVVIELKVAGSRPSMPASSTSRCSSSTTSCDQDRDDTTVGILLVVWRNAVVVEIALCGIDTPLAVSERLRAAAGSQGGPAER